MTVTIKADSTTYKNPSRPNLVRFRPNTPSPSGSFDVTNRKVPSNIGAYLINPSLPAQTIIK